MADNPGLRVHVTRTVEYTYDEHIFTEEGVRRLESEVDTFIRTRVVPHDAVGVKVHHTLTTEKIA